MNHNFTLFLMFEESPITYLLGLMAMLTRHSLLRSKQCENNILFKSVGPINNGIVDDVGQVKNLSFSLAAQCV